MDLYVVRRGLHQSQRRARFHQYLHRGCDGERGTPAGTIITDTDYGKYNHVRHELEQQLATVNIAVASATQADLSVTNSRKSEPGHRGQQYHLHADCNQ